MDRGELERLLAQLRAQRDELARSPRTTAPADDTERAAQGRTLVSLLTPCRKCHEMDAASTRLMPVRVAQPVLRRSVFNHAPHTIQARCESCHAGVRTSKAAADVNVPSIDSCRTCHNRSQVRDDCATCHRFHPVVSRSHDGGPAMKARLVLRRRDGTLQSFALGGQARIGSAPISEVMVERDRVSPLHAVLTLEDDAYWVEDKQSSVRHVREREPHRQDQAAPFRCADHRAGCEPGVPDHAARHRAGRDQRRTGGRAPPWQVAPRPRASAMPQFVPTMNEPLPEPLRGLAAGGPPPGVLKAAAEEAHQAEAKPLPTKLLSIEPDTISIERRPAGRSADRLAASGRPRRDVQDHARHLYSWPRQRGRDSHQQQGNVPSSRADRGEADRDHRRRSEERERHQGQRHRGHRADESLAMATPSRSPCSSSASKSSVSDGKDDDGRGGRGPVWSRRHAGARSRRRRCRRCSTC